MISSNFLGRGIGGGGFCKKYKFPQNFHNRKLDEITLLYPMDEKVLTVILYIYLQHH